jgi:hypothetical protein
MSTSAASITIRPTYPDDEPTIRRLAALDSAAMPAQPLLLAEVGGVVRAALSLGDGSAIADPFVPALHLVDLLRWHAAETAAPVTRRRGLRRYRPRRLAAQY